MGIGWFNLDYKAEPYY